MIKEKLIVHGLNVIKAAEPHRAFQSCHMQLKLATKRTRRVLRASYQYLHYIYTTFNYADNAYVALPLCLTSQERFTYLK